MMKHIILFLGVLVLFIFGSEKAKSLELLMFHDKRCHYCIAFDRDVGFDYNTSPRDVANALIAGTETLWEKELSLDIAH